jgi:C4-dicarboxylate-specific signal transduction histidine kinase
VATTVLHNVGNILNSVNVSASLLTTQLQESTLTRLGQAAEMLRSRGADLADFLAQDPKGKVLPQFLVLAIQRLTDRDKAMAAEVVALRKHVEHINEIVAMQQSYASVSGVLERLPVEDLVEEALRICEPSRIRRDVALVRDFQPLPTATINRHRVLQILVNLLQNANWALAESPRPDKQLQVRLGSDGNGQIRIVVADNGIGIPAENLTRIFRHGFTTRRNGHGFGLHGSAIAAAEMGGSLHAFSEGPGHGATFILELPLDGHRHGSRRAAPPTEPA